MSAGNRYSPVDEMGGKPSFQLCYVSRVHTSEVFFCFFVNLCSFILAFIVLSWFPFVVPDGMARVSRVTYDGWDLYITLF
jgi:hypothetical protein